MTVRRGFVTRDSRFTEAPDEGDHYLMTVEDWRHMVTVLYLCATVLGAIVASLVWWGATR